ncbi:E3 ubiquitin-protein ligase RNF144B-like [Pistacia vera]|uniref:E3 ubiquitin-protein ligase RNF144B-like n=1 Tax=Pistacia vera TaxID=55513 RepID=UPI001262ADC0|nr:E3 ubiquitin-protein ligase RNF144B-like [Pistacia vera]
MGNSLQKPTQNGENPQQETQEEDDVDSSFTCEICIEPLSANKKFKNKNRCVHPFCLDCIAKYIEVKIEDHTANIQCPGLNCEQVLDPLSCRAIISPSVFSKWCDLLCDNYVLGFERSYCPGTNCMEVVVNECGGNVKKSKCPNCRRFFCFQCKLAWHAGYGCAESRNMRDRNDILFGQLVERNTWTRCPDCGHCIELREGCKSVKCRFLSETFSSSCKNN